jgi:hypothetical protein
MTKKLLFCSVFISLLSLATAAHSQAKPNFSGTWKQNLEGSPTKSAWLKSYLNKIDQQGDTIKVTTTTSDDHGEHTYNYTYVIGKEEKSQDHDGDEITTVVKWEGSALVFESVEKERDAIKTSKATWILSDGGKTFTKTVHRSGPKGESEQKYILEKQ